MNVNSDFLTKKTIQALSLRDAINYVLEHNAKVDTSNGNSLERFYNNVVLYATDHSVNNVFTMRSEVVEEFRKYGICTGRELATVLHENADIAAKDIPFVGKIVVPKKKPKKDDKQL